jgi:type I restriction enzyme, S subunit
MMAATKNTNALYNTQIPGDWEVKKLGKLGNVVSGLTYSPDDICEETGVLVLRSSNVQGGRITFDDNVFVKVKQGDFNAVKKSDILICVRNGSKSLIGKCALINEDAEGMAFGAFMAIFRGDYNEYLIHVFNTDIYNREIHRNLGATINSINGSDLKEFKIPLPPLPEQKAIAQVLSTADAAIHTTEKLIAQKELRKKWLMQQLLTGKKRLLNDELGDMSYELKKVKLGDLIKLSSGDTKPIDTNQVYTSTYPFPVYGGNGIMCYSKVFNSNDDKIIIGRVGEYCGVTRLIYEKCWITDNALYTTKIDNCVSIQYLIYKLQHEDLSKLRSIGGQPLVSQKPIYNLSLIIHNSLIEQTAIAQVLQAADKEISLLKAKAEKLREQKKGLMQQLLTGKVRLKIN